VRNTSSQKYSRILGLALQVLCTSKVDKQRILKGAETYVLNLESQATKRGKPTVVQEYKYLHHFSVCKVLGHTLPEQPAFMKMRRGIPNRLLPIWWMFISDCDETKRLGLTITRSYESIFVNPELKSNPITDSAQPTISPEEIDEYSSFISKWVNSSFISSCKRNNLTINRPKGTLKRGPNGPSIPTAHFDALAIYKDQALYEYMSAFANLTNNQWIMEWIKLIHKLSEGRQEILQENIHSRLTVIPQAGGKSRVIAIGDYFSQNLLRPLHNQVMRALSRLKTDGTYDQNRAFKQLLDLPLNTKVFCFDLSSATDRAPIWMQELMLKHIYGSDLAESWRRLISERDFKYANKFYRWKVGQPLGLLSSWAVFSLWHHSIIQYCGRKNGHRLFLDYLVLGDDVAIWNPEVALTYKDIMKKLDIPINFNKSFISTGSVPYGEFAKRVFRGGTELTGLGPAIITKGLRSISGWMFLWEYMLERNWPVTREPFTVPPNFTSEARKFSWILAFVKGWVYAPIEGITLSALLNLDYLKPFLVEERINQIRKQLNNALDLMKSQDGIISIFSNEGIAVNDELFEYRVCQEHVHPIMHDLNYTACELLELLDTINENQDDLLKVLEIHDIESVPTVDRYSYFTEKKIFKENIKSRLTIKAWNKALESVEGSLHLPKNKFFSNTAAVLFNPNSEPFMVQD